MSSWLRMPMAWRGNANDIVTPLRQSIQYVFMPERRFGRKYLKLCVNTLQMAHLLLCRCLSSSSDSICRTKRRRATRDYANFTEDETNCIRWLRRHRRQRILLCLFFEVNQWIFRVHFSGLRWANWTKRRQANWWKWFSDSLVLFATFTTFVSLAAIRRSVKC